MAKKVSAKDPQNVEPFFFVWCDWDGTNDGSAVDDGELQGATISTYTLTVPSGVTKTTDNKAAVTIRGVAYAINTVVAVWLSGGTDNKDYAITCQVVTSDGRTLEQTMIVPVRSK
jgi:hypothetical protein